jgi:uncharacterized membrane protein YccC
MVETEGAAGGRRRPSAIGRALEGWKARDPGLRATHRSIRAAVVVPAVFALADFGVGNGQTTLFGVFGCFALLLFVDFGGPTRVRLRSYAGLLVAGAVLIVAGTLCSTYSATAVIGMAVFGFAVLFAGAVSPQAAVASTAALLTFVLPVAVPGGTSAIGSRLAGWGLAAAFSIPAVMLVWSGRWHDPLRRAVADAARALARLVEAHAEGRLDPPGWQRAGDAMDQLRARYEATPYRPAGAGPTDSALVSLVSRMEWVGQNALVPLDSGSVLADNRPVQRINAAVARVLHQIADLVEEEDALTSLAKVGTLAEEVNELASAREASMGAAWEHLLAHVGEADQAATDAFTDGGAPSLWTVDPTYPSRMLAFATEMTADVTLGTVPHRAGDGVVARVRRSLQAMLQSALSRLTFRSVWFRNSVRGAVGLSLAVAVAQATDVQHGFWVVLGTLSVLRSNALGTGATALRAVAGTVIGFVVGSALLVALGTHLDLLWAVLPFAVLVAGVAPSVISFTAGQAGFTVAIVIVFNIIDPVGWKVGLVRVEDIAIGVLVSIVVGLLFWPRGAPAELARTLSEAYAGATAWLVVEIGRAGVPGPGTEDEVPRTLAMVTADRLDDAFRQFMSERGAKRMGLSAVTHLVTGCARVRLMARALASLPAYAAPPGASPLAAVRSVADDVTEEFAAAQRWYEELSRALRERPVDLPTEPPDANLRPGLTAALENARQARRTDEMLTALRLLWLAERLEELRELRTELAGSVGRFAGIRVRSSTV